MNWFFELFTKKSKSINYEKAQMRLDEWANDKTRTRTGYTFNHKRKIFKKTPREVGKVSKKRTCTSTPEIRKSNGRFG